MNYAEWTKIVGPLYKYFKIHLGASTTTTAKTTKTSLKKWIRATSNIIALFPTRSIPQMLTNFLESNCKILQSSGKEGESRCLVFTSSSKREIRHFHVVVVQRRQRNVQKGVMHVQSCCFANLNQLLFCRSCCRRPRRCLSSLLSLPLRRLFKATLHETIRNNDFQRNTALQCWNNVATIWSNVATILCVMLCCSKNRCCESSCVTSPLATMKHNSIGTKHG